MRPARIDGTAPCWDGLTTGGTAGQDEELALIGSPAGGVCCPSVRFTVAGGARHVIARAASLFHVDQAVPSGVLVAQHGDLRFTGVGVHDAEAESTAAVECGTRL